VSRTIALVYLNSGYGRYNSRWTGSGSLAELYRWPGAGGRNPQFRQLPAAGRCGEIKASSRRQRVSPGACGRSGMREWRLGGRMIDSVGTRESGGGVWPALTSLVGQIAESLQLGHPRRLVPTGLQHATADLCGGW